MSTYSDRNKAWDNLQRSRAQHRADEEVRNRNLAAAADLMCGGHGVLPRNQPSPEPVDDFNREYDIAPWAFDDGE